MHNSISVAGEEVWQGAKRGQGEEAGMGEHQGLRDAAIVDKVKGKCTTEHISMAGEWVLQGGSEGASEGRGRHSGRL